MLLLFSSNAYTYLFILYTLSHTHCIFTMQHIEGRAQGQGRAGPQAAGAENRLILHI